MKMDVEGKNHAYHNTFGRMFLAKRCKSKERRITKTGAVYCKPDVSATITVNELEVGSSILPLARYKDDSRERWYRIEKGWLKKDIVTSCQDI